MTIQSGALANREASFWDLMFFLKIIAQSVANGTLPKIFRPSPIWQSFRLSNSVVIADYDLIKEAFSKRELCCRLYNPKDSKYEALQSKDSSIISVLNVFIKSYMSSVQN